MDKMFFPVLMLMFILINLQVETKDTCNDECVSKTYCLSSDGSGVCSKNNLVTAQFKVLPVFGKYGKLQLTLKGYKIGLNDEKTIKVDLNANNQTSNVYSCFKTSFGLTYAKFDRSNFTSITGPSFYSDGILNCFWTFNFGDPIWPHSDIHPVDMILESFLSITLYHGSHESKVAQDISQLPIYHAQYLKCCSKFHGNDQFMLTFNQIGKQIFYQLFYLRSNLTYPVDVTLTRKDGIILQFKCDFKHEGFSSSMRNGTKQISIDGQLIKVIHSRICSWSTPFVLGDSKTSINTSTSIFDLKVEADNYEIYSAKDVSLRNSSHLVKSSFILFIFAVLFRISMIHS